MKFRGQNRQSGLFDYHERMELLANRPRALDRLNAAVNFDGFRAVLLEHLRYTSGGPKGGRPPFDPVLMLKVLVLQKYHNLSDEETEFQILDRISFQRFLGLGVGDPSPDRNTIWEFKQRLGEEGVRAVFDLFETNLREMGLMGRAGKIVDASFVETPRQRNSREDNDRILRGERPEHFDENPHRGRQKDTDARWAKKNNEVHFGYKNHIKADAATKFINDYKVTPASTHESQTMPDLLKPGDGDIFADSAYVGAPIADSIEDLGLGNHIHERGTRARPLNPFQRETNRLKSRIRARVEHVFGFQANNMGADRIRTIGIKRARCSIGLGNFIYNLFRYETLKRTAG